MDWEEDQEESEDQGCEEEAEEGFQIDTAEELRERALVKTWQHVDEENVSGVLRRLDSIRQL